MKKHLEDAVYITVTKETYDHYQELKKFDLTRENFGDKDAPLENIPFFLNDYEFRILQYRYHLLQALQFEEWREGWSHIGSKDVVIPNEVIKTASDSDFLDAIEATGVKVNFTLK